MLSHVHVEDVAQAFVDALAEDGTIGKTFELGDPVSGCSGKRMA